MDTLSEAEAAIADRAYDAREKVLEPLAESDTEIVIPSKRHRLEQREHDRHLYAARHLIENLFGRLKGRYRAIATRYDKTAAIFLGAVHMAAAMDWLR